MPQNVVELVSVLYFDIKFGLLLSTFPLLKQTVM